MSTVEEPVPAGNGLFADHRDDAMTNTSIAGAPLRARSATDDDRAERGTVAETLRREPEQEDSAAEEHRSHGRGPSQATRLVQLAEGLELFHTAESEAYATL